jgi:hypothetical protein
MTNATQGIEAGERGGLVLGVPIEDRITDAMFEVARDAADESDPEWMGDGLGTPLRQRRFFAAVYLAMAAADSTGGRHGGN